MSQRLSAATVASLLAIALGACTEHALHPTFGDVYRANFGAQVADREVRPVAPFNGDEAKRVVGSYYQSLGDDTGAAGGGGKGSAAPSGGGAGSAPASPGGFTLRGR